MKIIPAIDIIDGKAVRLTKGDYNQKKIYNAAPLAVAKEFEQAGFSRLHLVDLDGAKNRRITNLKVLESIAKGTTLQIDYGGGIQDKKDVMRVFSSGAFQCTLGSIAAKQPALIKEWIKEFNSEKFFIGADVMEEKIRLSGWVEKTDISVYDFLKEMLATGFQYFFCTDISKDGMLHGPSVALYKKILQRFPGIHLTASGGVSTIQDLKELQEAGCAGAIVGKAIYEGKISLKELKQFHN